jgi:hypothetical protein
LSYGRISAIDDTPETITCHQQPSDFSGLRSTVMGEFQSVGALQAITDHQVDISRIAPALLPKTLPSDTDLAAVVEAVKKAWPKLSGNEQAALTAAVRSIIDDDC